MIVIDRLRWRRSIQLLHCLRTPSYPLLHVYAQEITILGGIEEGRVVDDPLAELFIRRLFFLRGSNTLYACPPTGPYTRSMDEPVLNRREKDHAADLVAHRVPIREWWFRDNALLSFLFNASSTTVPDGELFIVRAVDEGRKLIDDQDLKDRAQVLIHEETAHARMHYAYNRYLEAIGLPSKKYNEETKRLIAYFERRFSLMDRLATCAMIEHFTAIFSKQVLDAGVLEGEDVDERMDRVWSWHCIEELEHRSTAIDIYRTLGGGYLRRIWIAFITSVLFAFTHTRCLIEFLRAKKVLWRVKTWRTGMPYVFGRKGVYRLFLTEWVKYFLPGFHPTKIPIENRFNKQLHHYHIEEELVGYFPPASEPIGRIGSAG